MEGKRDRRNCEESNDFITGQVDVLVPHYNAAYACVSPFIVRGGGPVLKSSRLLVVGFAATLH